MRDRRIRGFLRRLQESTSSTLGDEIFGRTNLGNT
jgi:hypothetical protein